MRNFIIIMSILLFGLIACKKEASQSEPVVSETTAVDAVKVKKEAVKKKSAESFSEISFSGRIIDLFDSYVVVKKGSVERRYYYTDESKFYNLQGDLISKDDLWINHIVKIKGIKRSQKYYIKSLQIVSEMSL